MKGSELLAWPLVLFVAVGAAAAPGLPPPSRWIDPEGRPKPHHTVPSRASSFEIRPAPTAPPPTKGPEPLDQPAPLAAAGRICAVVADPIYTTISNKLSRYSQDLSAAGYSVETYRFLSGNAEDLRSYLSGLYHQPASLVGAVLIGDLPYIVYEMMQDWDDGGRAPEYEDFPCDLFLMDLDGTWSDTLEDQGVHAGNGKYDTWQGDQNLEIWVCRWKTSALTDLGTQTSVLTNYFEKDHNYRQRVLRPAPTALVYIDDDWAYGAPSDEAFVKAIYGPSSVTVVSNAEATTAADFSGSRLPASQEFLFTRSHGVSTGHGFYRNGRTTFEWVMNSAYRGIDPPALFYHFYACSGADFTVPNSLSGIAAFNQQASLTVWGSTKTGGLLDDEVFNDLLAGGACIGRAFRDWFNAVRAGPYAPYVPRYLYGMVIIGDATLAPSVTTFVLEVALLPYAHEGDGLLPGQGSVSIPWPLPTGVSVSLTSDLTNDLIVPASVTITAGQTSVSFDFTVMDNFNRDGDRVRTVTATAPGWTTGRGEIDIWDDERRTYYVNDTGTVNDAWCSAPGDDAQTGTTTNQPKANLQSILEAYTLYGGDVVYVDTGFYPLSSNLVIGPGDAGSASARLVFAAARPARALRTDSARGADALYIDRAPYVEITDLTITGGSWNVYLDAATNCVFSRIAARGGSTGGFCLSNATLNQLSWIDVAGSGGDGFSMLFSDRNLLSHSSIRYNLDDGVVAAHSPSNTVEHAVIVANNNDQVFVYGSASSLSVRNTVVVATGSSAYGVTVLSGVYSGDYNDLYAVNGGVTGYDAGLECQALHEWQRATGQDLHSLSHEPAFADVPSADFHPLSSAGRFLPSGTWTNDALHSPCIDTGDPGAPYAAETSPHGGRANIGMYGNTAEASRGLTNAWLLTCNVNDRSLVTGAVELHWTSGNLATDALVRVEASFDGGSTWTQLAAAVSASLETLAWDTPSWPGTPAARWRVVLESDSNVLDSSDCRFPMRNQPLTYYVNDGNTSNDLYCSAPGNDANVGIASNAPRASLAAVFNEYNLYPGDLVYVDTGNYVLSSNVVIRTTHSGDASRYVTVKGSPKGTWLARASTASGAYALVMDQAAYVQLTDLCFSSGRYTVYLYGARHCLLSNITVRSPLFRGAYVAYSDDNTLAHLDVADCGSDGIDLYYSDRNTLANCRAWTNGDEGLVCRYSVSNVVQNATLAFNGGDQVALEGPKSVLDLRNSILVAQGTNHCIFIQAGRYRGDYNDLYAGGGAHIGNSNGTLHALADWQASVGQDANSLSQAPLFADAAAGDLHLRSIRGRFVAPGIWTNDPVESPGIDAGDPASPFATEPAPNGARVNLGAFGNTVQASMSRSNMWFLTVVSPYGGASPTTNGPGLHLEIAPLLCRVTNSPVFRGVLATQYVCAGWSVSGSTDTNGAGQGEGAAVWLSLTNDAVLNWRWQTNYWLALAAETNGTVDTTSHWAMAGSPVVATALAALYHHFDRWSGDTNGCSLDTNWITVPMTAPYDLTAHFAANLAALGTPEVWLVFHGLTNDTFDAEELKDTDSDGMPAWQERIADTDPTNQGSSLRILDVTGYPGAVRIFWQGGIVSRQYLERCPALTPSGETWQAFFTNAPPTPASTNVLDNTPPDRARFYRLRAVRE